MAPMPATTVSPIYTEAFIDSGFLVVQARGGSWVYDPRTDAWSVVRGGRGGGKGISSPAIGAPGAAAFLINLGNSHTGGVPSPDERRGGTVARLDPVHGRWLVAALPVRGGPASVFVTPVWTGDRFLFWGGATLEVDRKSRGGCSGGGMPDQPVCDPIVPTREVPHAEGAMWRPTLR